jgi:hypothetical protein
MDSNCVKLLKSATFYDFLQLRVCSKQALKLFNDILDFYQNLDVDLNDDRHLLHLGIQIMRLGRLLIFLKFFKPGFALMALALVDLQEIRLQEAQLTRRACCKIWEEYVTPWRSLRRFRWLLENDPELLYDLCTAGLHKDIGLPYGFFSLTVPGR